MSYSSLVWTESFLTGYLTASRTHSDGILSPRDLVPPRFLLKKKKKSFPAAFYKEISTI